MRYVPALARKEIEEAARDHHALWSSGRTEEEHIAHIFEQLSSAGPELLRYVGLLDETGLLASLKRYALLLHHPDAPGAHRAVGIGAVFTRPAARRRGAASALIREVMREASDLGYSAALLYSDIGPAFYERLGFVALPAIEHVARPVDLPDEGALAIRPAEPADLDRLLAFHEEGIRVAGPVLCPLRSRALFRYFRYRSRIRGEWLLSDHDRDVGYLIAGRADPLRDLPEPREEDLLWVDEWAAPGVPADRVWATVRALSSREGTRVIGTWLPPHQASARFQARPRPSALPMIAPLSPSFPIDPRRAFLDSFAHF
jgi:GNAT superfamily N-acetyltransferase